MDSKFVKVKCDKCKNEQIIFSKATTLIKCLVCNNVLAKPTGGKTSISTKMLKTLD